MENEVLAFLKTLFSDEMFKSWLKQHPHIIIKQNANYVIIDFFLEKLVVSAVVSQMQAFL